MALYELFYVLFGWFCWVFLLFHFFLPISLPVFRRGFTVPIQKLQMGLAIKQSPYFWVILCDRFQLAAGGAVLTSEGCGGVIPLAILLFLGKPFALLQMPRHVGTRLSVTRRATPALPLQR